MEARALTPSEKGGIAEMMIAAKAALLGIQVLRPMTEGHRYDLAFDVGDRILRVQCKWGNLRDGVVVARIGGSRLTPLAGYVRSTYDADEIDIIAVYCAAVDDVFALPISVVAGKSYLHLRISPAKNNQSDLVNWAAALSAGGYSSVGRAFGWQPKGRGFESL